MRKPSFLLSPLTFLSLLAAVNLHLRGQDALAVDPAQANGVEPAADATNLDAETDAQAQKEPPGERKVERFVADKGLNHRWVMKVTPLADGTVVTNRSYVHIEPGLHFLDEQGGLRESQDLIELTPDGAEARHGQIKVKFAPDITTSGAIDIETPEGNHLRGAPLGLSYYDAKSGESVLIAETKSTIGEIIPPNRLVYRNFLDDIEADVVYEYKKGGFMQLVLIKEKLPPPSFYGLSDESSRLEVMTEFSDSPQPVQHPSKIRKEEDQVKRASMVEPDFNDTTLSFGRVLVPRGTAFGVFDDDQEPTRRHPVGKHWQELPEEARSVLFESVEYEAVQPDFETLPEREHIKKPVAAAIRSIPARRIAAKDSKPIRLAITEYRPTGIAIDYITVPGGTSAQFDNGITYYVEANTTAYFTSGNFSGGAIIKCGSGAKVSIQSSAYFQGSDATPTIFTSANDDYFGEVISGSNGKPNLNWYSGPALHLTGSNLNPSTYQYVVNGLRVRYAQQGIEVGGSGAISHSLSNTRFENCGTAVIGSGSTVVLSNVRTCNVVALKVGSVSGTAATDCSDTLYNNWPVATTASSAATSPALAFDEVFSTAWQASSSDQNPWIGADLGKTFTVAALRYFPPTVNPASFIGYKIWVGNTLISNGDVTTSLGSPLASGAWGSASSTLSRFVSFSATSGRYVHLQNNPSNSGTGAAAELRIYALNSGPTIQNISDQQIFANVISPEINVDIADGETPIGYLAPVATASDNPALIPTSAVTFSGTGTTRTMRITPTTGALGVANLTITVTDGHGLSASDSFQVTVVAPPLSQPTLNYQPGTYNNDVNLTVTASSGAMLRVFRPNPNLINPGAWANGGPSQPGFTASGTSSGENSVEDAATAYGTTDKVWVSRNMDTATGGANDADGGWTTTDFTIDPTKTYRFSVWVKKLGGTSGNAYLGCKPSTVTSLSGSTPDTNPYFWFGQIPVGQWYLVVGHVRPAGYAGSLPTKSGIYDTISGTPLTGSNFAVTDFRWVSGIAVSRHRAYQYYCTDLAVQTQFWYPRVEIVNAADDPLDVLRAPEEASPKYISLTGNTLNTVHAMASSGLSRSSVAGGTYTFQAAAPIVSQLSDGSLAASTATTPPDIRYTTNGTEPITTSKAFVQPPPPLWLLNGTTKWKAFKTGYNPSGTVVLNVTLTDTDTDQMADGWESYYFGGLGQLGTSDWDGDGVNNLTEFQTRTLPTTFNGLSLFTPLD